MLALIFTGCGKKELQNEPEISDSVSYLSPDSNKTIWPYWQLRICDFKNSQTFEAALNYAALNLSQNQLRSVSLANINQSGVLGLYKRDEQTVYLSFEGLYLYNEFAIIKINNKQVLGPQQPAISDASGQTDTERKLNLLLEACREHGLIARGDLVRAVREPPLH